MTDIESCTPELHNRGDAVCTANLYITGRAPGVRSKRNLSALHQAWKAVCFGKLRHGQSPGSTSLAFSIALLNDAQVLLLGKLGRRSAPLLDRLQKKKPLKSRQGALILTGKLNVGIAAISPNQQP